MWIPMVTTTTRASGIPEVLRDNIDSILVDVGDSDAVDESLLRLRSPSIRREMGLIAQERVKAGFTIKKQADTFLMYVNKTINNQSKL